MSSEQVVNMTIQQLNASNATHLLQCRHALGDNGKFYKKRCHILKKMPDGRLKLQVYGDRYWKDTDHIVRIRYVESSRVSQITPSGDN
ncbi:DUF3319 domain-containing protein [Vibrio crassostreae]|nr:DUF3319 domain-containing protein [Vibrio crassostreae]